MNEPPDRWLGLVSVLERRKKREKRVNGMATGKGGKGHGARTDTGCTFSFLVFPVDC